MPSIAVFKCPEVSLPEKQVKENGYSGKKRSRDTFIKGNNFKAKKAEVDRLHADIKDFSSTSLIGLAKKKFKDDKLTRLGAPPPKQQTMPFKMKMGIEAGRKKRLLKAINRGKESGTLLPSSVTGGSAKKDDRKKKMSSSSEAHFNLNTKQGVLHMSKDRIPQKLMNKLGRK